MNTYCFKVGSTLCEIEVQARPTINGPAAFVATASVSEDEGRLLRPIWKNEAPMPLELVSGSEDDAVTRMGRFLEKTFGPGSWPIELCAAAPNLTQVLGQKWIIES